jgi:hypothetical protein|tara:strand:+ start:664 stop:972 length:309 start_codon:yes stop_codon:yes gene_type:complete
MLNLNKTSRNAVMYIAVLMGLISVLTVLQGRSSGYQPRPITINAVSEGSLFDLDHSEECVPGAPNGSPYTKSLTPGGLCGAQGLVADHAGYSISGGIGGSLI